MVDNKVLIAYWQSLGYAANVELCTNHDTGNLSCPYWIHFEMIILKINLF